jgi:hypothetical protein
MKAKKVMRERDEHGPRHVTPAYTMRYPSKTGFARQALLN